MTFELYEIVDATAPSHGAPPPSSMADYDQVRFAPPPASLPDYDQVRFAPPPSSLS